jgi:predicted SnoaL-like aldol condensation-catalyzing enzyme
MSTNKDSSAQSSRTRLVRKLPKGIETGDHEAAAVVNEKKCIQHNPQTAEGGEGLAALFARLARTKPKVFVVRARWRLRFWDDRV